MKTLLLLAVLTALLLGLGQVLGGRGGMLIALVLAFVMNFVSFWFSDKIVLRMYGAREVTEAEAPQLFGLVASLAQKAQLPMPRVYVIPEEAPNAFATGRSPEKAAVAVTEGILRILDRDELAGVLAHELSHVRNRDTLVMTVAATIAGAIGQIANMATWALMFGGGRSSDDERGGNPLGLLVGAIVAPIAAMLVQMAISRSREYMADESGARIAGSPAGLASALRKLEAWKQEVPMQHGSPATAHLFIVNPFTGGGLASLFSTHPSTAERVARLEALALDGGIRPA